MPLKATSREEILATPYSMTPKNYIQVPPYIMTSIINTINFLLSLVLLKIFQLICTLNRKNVVTELVKPD